jgi:predicted Zn-dependent protease
VAGTVYIYYKYLDPVPLTERQRWIATSPEWERQVGDQEYQKLLQQYRGQILPTNHRASITVDRVGNRIAKAALDFAKQHDLDYNTNSITFTLVKSEMANAFVLPNNHIFVMTGLFRFARDEDELAAVLGHEMAHNLARHVGEKVSGSVLVRIFANLTFLIDPSGVLFSIFLPTASLLRELPHSRI